MNLVSSGQPSLPGLQKSIQFCAAGQERLKAGDRQKAILFFQAAINTCPLNGAPYVPLLQILLESKDITNAQKVADAVPDVLYGKNDVLRGLKGLVLLEAGRPEEAISVLEPLVGNRNVNQAALLNNLGTCYHRIESLEKSLSFYEAAAQQGLSDENLYLNLAGIYTKLGQTGNAERAYIAGLAAYPEDDNLNYEYAIFLLKEGRFKQAFSRYHHRFGARGFGMRKVALPIKEWQGAGSPEHMLVVLEQGVGDQVVFSAMLRDFSRKFSKLSVTSDSRLHGLLKRTFPDIEFFSNGLRLDDPVFKKFDAFVHSGDVGRFIDKPSGFGGFYLKPDEQKVDQIRQRYRQLFPGKKIVAICWRSKREVFGEMKTVPLSYWSDVLRDDRIQFVNFQYGDVAGELQQVLDDIGVSVYCDPHIDAFNDLEGLAAQALAVDLVMTTSNSNAHLAAASGANVWLIAPSGSGLLWYWGVSGDRCAWYPDVKIFRPDVAGAWGGVMKRVQETLNHYLEAGNAT